MRRYVIGYPVRNGKVLLIHKKRGLGEGLYNGVGGKVEDGEGPEKAIVREAEEEIGIKVKRFRRVAKIFFYDNYGTSMEVDVFLIEEWEGEPVESDEARPEWFPIDCLPYDRMWEDDRVWLWKVLRGEKLTAKFWFNDIWGKHETPRMLRCEVSAGIVE